MLEDLGFPIADSYVCFWLAFLLWTFTCANYTPTESLVCKGQLINSTLHALECVYIMDNKREIAHMRSNVEIIKLCEKV